MITGSLDESGSLPRTTVWTVPDFFQLPQHVGFACYSKEFSFMELKCRLAIMPHGSESLPNIMIVAFYRIGREEIPRWEMEVRRENGTMLQRCTGSMDYTDEMGVSMYVPVEDVEKGCSAQGFMRIICRLYHEEATTYYAEENINDKGSQTGEMTKTDKLSCDMEEMMLREDYCDVTIKVEDKEYVGHKAIFGIRSPVFMNMFKYQMSENITGVVDIDDCDAVVFREFMRYIYASRVSKTFPRVLFPLYHVADKYQVVDLKAYCIEQIKSIICVENFSNCAELCFQYNDEHFMDIVIEFLAENMSEIRKSEEWKNFDSENPEEADTLIQKALKYQKLTAKSKKTFLQKVVKLIVGGK